MKLSLPLKNVAKKKIITSFIDDYGLVYFGHVDQHDDEHQVVRGMTVSHTHRDEYYSIGTYQTYDVSFVERTDSTKSAQTKKLHHTTWHILQFDLHTKVDLPHIFIGLHSHSESFYRHLFTKYSHLRQLTIGVLRQYDPMFISHYRVYGPPSEHIQVETILSGIVDQVFVKNFGSLAIEINDGSLYVYSEHAPLSRQILDAMMKNGVWLARHVDEISKTI